jgi:hypothetical protein
VSSKGAELAAAGRVFHMLNRGDGLPLPGLFLYPAGKGAVSVPFDNVPFKVVCGFVPEPGKIKADSRRRFNQPRFGSAYFCYFKTLHNYLYRNSAPPEKARKK